MMMDQKDAVTIDDLSTLAAEEKVALVEYCKAAFADNAISKLKTGKKSITVTHENKITYILIAEQEKI